VTSAASHADASVQNNGLCSARLIKQDICAFSTWCNPFQKKLFSTDSNLLHRICEITDLSGLAVGSGL
jgi:hypothetical protein